MKNIITLLIVTFFAVPAFSQTVSTDFHFRHFSVENGLSSNTVRALMQDKQGFLWIGTDEGLNRYDGTSIQQYQYSPRGSNANYISALYEDEGMIWIGTDNGVYKYTYCTDSFRPFETTTANHTKITANVTDIVRDKDGNLWFATNGQGVFRYNEGNEQLEHHEFSSNLGIVHDLLIDSENKVWAISNQGNAHLYRLNKAENKFEPFALTYGPGQQGQDSRGLVMFEDSESTFWLGTWECGLQKIDRYSGCITTYLHPSGKDGIMHIHSIHAYDTHRLLIGSDDGLSLFDTVTGKHTLFTEDETNPYSLSNRFVYPILKDREGGIWIGTYYGGVNYISPSTRPFESYSYSRFFNSVGGNVIGRFCEDPSGQIWIASDDGGLSCFSPEKKHFTNYMPDERATNSLSYHNIHALCMDGDNLWIGTYSRGVNVLHLPTRTFKTYTSSAQDIHSLDDNSAYAIYKDREERIWVASMSGVNLYDREKDHFIRVKNLGTLTIDIDQDTKGNLWFCTQGRGLFKYDPAHQVWKNYLFSEAPGSLPSNQINCVQIDRKGEIWVGTMNGLCKYNASADTFETIPLNIPSQNICCIIEDQHVLWLTTSKGLVQYIPGEGCRVFTKSDGLRSDQFIPNAGLKTSDGKIYVGSVNGFNAFYPYLIKPNKVIPPVVITGLEIYNKKIRIGDPLLPKAPNYADRFELSYKDNVFSLHYASLSYCTPEKNQYAYKLEGFDKEWNYVGSQNKATYTNLPAGTYLFKVKASNNDGIWNEEGTALKIVIHPPFYWSAYSKTLYFFLLCVAFIFLIRFILHRTEKKHTEEINQLNANKEKEVHEAKIKFFTMIAHEIRTPVSLIIGPLEKIMNSPVALPPAVRDDLHIIDRNSQRLLSLINQLLDFRKVEQEGIQMKCVSQPVCQLLRSIGDRFRPFTAQAGVKLETDYPETDFVARIDTEAITKLVSNLLTNASKYTKDRILLSCRVQPEQHTFVIRVTDNGCGISKEEQQKIFKPFYQAMDNKPGTGIGLSIVQGIVKAHNGIIDVESEPGKGSSFIVTLPLEQPEAVTEQEETDMLNPSLPEGILSDTLTAPSSPHKPTMLIVDDNKEMLSFLSGSLAETYHILTAEDGLEALEQLNGNEITLIICDWMMPRMNGVEFCKAVRANPSTSHIPFILLTAKTDVHSKIEGMDCGADAYIEKPFSLQYLEACIKNLVDLRNLLRQKFSKMPLVPLNSIAGNPSDDKFLTRMNEIIEANFANAELSVDFLAEKLCISRSSLFAKIKTLANITPNELIQVVRLKKAAALLAGKQYRINEICYMVGFNNPSYFSKCFQKQFGMKPGEFANSQKNTPAPPDAPEA